MRRTFVDTLCKRALDVTAATAGLALFLPVMLVTALAIRINMGPPILSGVRWTSVYSSEVSHDARQLRRTS
jgi:lipopolysaccharide/colanic/teichoic acid biosynthesis glycosyltransferase